MKTNTRRGLGKGMGCGYKNLVPKDPFIHGLSAKGVKTEVTYRRTKSGKRVRIGTNVDGTKNYVFGLDAKGKKDYMRSVIRFEDMNPDYPSTQMQGIVFETAKNPPEWQDKDYIDEKVDNTKRFYDGILDNFGNRIKDGQIQAEFQKKLKEGKLNAKSIIKLKPKDQVVIKANRWFDKVNGNTYHSVEVYVNGKLVGNNPFEYGYDEAYMQTAFDILADKGYFPYEKTKENVPVKDKQGVIQYYTPKESMNKNEAYWNFIQYQRDHRKNFLIFANDVERKRDL